MEEKKNKICWSNKDHSIYVTVNGYIGIRINFIEKVKVHYDNLDLLIEILNKLKKSKKIKTLIDSLPKKRTYSLEIEE